MRGLILELDANATSRKDHSVDVPVKPLSYLERLVGGNRASRFYNGWKQIRVYFVRSFDDRLKRRVYFYAVVEAPRHDEMMLSLNDGNIPDFAVIVEKGFDDPTPEMKAKMKEYYGFDHDRYANDQPLNREEKD